MATRPESGETLENGRGLSGLAGAPHHHLPPLDAAAGRATPPPRAGRPDAGPVLLAAIRVVLADTPFHGEGHRKVWARLRLRGVRSSRRRVLRLMRESDLLAPSHVCAPRGPRQP